MRTVISFGGYSNEITVTEDYGLILRRLAEAGHPRTINPPDGPSVELAGWVAATLVSGPRIEVQASSIAYIRPE